MVFTSDQIGKLQDFGNSRLSTADASQALKSESSKQEPQRKITVKTTKAVHVTAVDYNEKIGLLALALIDKEVKIYQIRQQGTKNALCEHFSFFTYFPSGAATSCLQIEKFVTNGRPIICLGS